MILLGMEVGQLGTNCYIVGCEETREAAVIDPGGDALKILKFLERNNLKLTHIINTHGHIDHIGGNRALKDQTQAELIIHEEDASMLTSAGRNLSLFSGMVMSGPAADRTVKEGDKIKVGNTVVLEVIHTPGHTPGGMSLKLEVDGKNILFVGDTLFNGSIGRTDFPGGSYRQLIESIQQKIMVFPDETEVYPGHGPGTTVGFERKSNPFLV
ncbi:MAG: MBL fold metallo-hydrolase [Syntrophomonadaceae bacterium]|nr:MBL fold metallo-hydrolase [Syntrophomonadaceae bacterium]